MRYRYKGRGKVKANGYYWEKDSIVDVTDEATLKKLKTHPSFEKID